MFEGIPKNKTEDIEYHPHYEWKPRIEKVIPDEEIERCVVVSAPNISEKIHFLREVDLGAYEHAWEEYKEAKAKDPDVMASDIRSIPQNIADQLRNYGELMHSDIWTRDEVLELVGADTPELLADLLRQKIVIERQTTEKVLEHPESQRFLNKAADGMSKFVEQVGSSELRPELSPVQFIGKYEGLVLASTESCFSLESYVGRNNSDGQYLPHLDGIIIGISAAEFETEEIGLTTTRTFIHESFHSLGPKQNVTPTIGINYTLESSVGGLRTYNPENKRRPYGALSALDEGTTELCAKIVARAQFEDAKSAISQRYALNVVNVAALVDALSEHEASNEVRENYTDLLKEEGLKILFAQYTSSKSLLHFGREIEKKIGRHVFSLFEALSDYPQDPWFARFITSLQRYRAGEEAPQIPISTFALERCGLTFEEINTLYPFIVLGE